MYRPAGSLLGLMTVLDHAVVDGALAGSAWKRDGDHLVKVTKHGTFVPALAYVNAVGAVAESFDHHPDIDIRWDTVTLRLTNHSAGGLTQKDLDVAAAIDEIP